MNLMPARGPRFVSRIAYLSSYLGGLSGAGQSGIDVLIAMLLTDNLVTVISNTGQRFRLPDIIDGRPVTPPRWVTPPRSFPTGPMQSMPYRLGSWLVTFTRDPFWRMHLKKMEEPDLTVVNSFNKSLLDISSLIQPALRNNLAMVVRGSPREETFQLMDRDLSWALSFMSDFNHLVFVSERTQQQWMCYDQLKHKRAFYIPNCCREDLAIPLVKQSRIEIRRKLNLPSNKFIAVCVGSLQQRKGQDILLDNLSSLLKTVPDLWIFLVGPSKTQWGRNLRKRAMKVKWSERFNIVGAQRNAMEYIRAADVMIVPSRAEAMPRVILEAMALKTPVVASNIDGNPELIQHGNNGLVFELDEPGEMVESIGMLASDPSLRSDIAEQAYNRYWSNFSRSLQIQRYASAIDSMLSDNPTLRFEG